MDWVFLDFKELRVRWDSFGVTQLFWHFEHATVMQESADADRADVIETEAHLNSDPGKWLATSSLQRASAYFRVRVSP